MRRGGWGAAIALALVATLISTIHPALLIAVPLAVLLIALPPMRSPYRLVGVLLLVLLFSAPVTGPLWYAERGWALILGATFLGAVTLWPGGRFLPRAILSVAAASVVAAGILLVTGAWRRVEWAIARRFREAATFWTARLDGTGDPSAAQMADTFRGVVDLEVMLYPAMLGLASLAALAVAWWGYRRLVDRSGEALAPLREFRFADHLVWLLIAGALLLLLPIGEAWVRTGANLATFMGALYVVRGAAILLVLTGATGVGAFLMGVIAVLLLPLVATAALVIGLSDIWLDLRRRRASSGPASS